MSVSATQAHRIPLLAILTWWTVFSAAGCSSTYYVAPERTVSRNDTVSIGLFNRRMADRSAVVTTTDQREYSASTFSLTKDSCSFLDNGGDRRVVLPLKEIGAITRTDHLSSAVGGMGLGLLSGVTLGSGVALLAHPSGSDERMGYGLLWMATTAVGTVTGLVVGAIVGTTIEYRFAAPVDSSAASTPPRYY